MKVHFITSRPSLEKDIDTLRQITDVIKQSGHSIAYEWIDGAFKREIQSKTPASDWNAIYKDNLGAIAQSDVIIAETTYENFAVGYQVAVAVQQKKPVLLLRNKEADENTFVTGVEDGWVKRSIYGRDDVEGTVKHFLAENDISTKDMRFNFFIDRPIYNYLRWAALKTGKTKAEILRELVQHEIEKKDS
jgi:nucleoside 2-deoxyribosyltransferase